MLRVLRKIREYHCTLGFRRVVLFLAGLGLAKAPEWFFPKSRQRPINMNLPGLKHPVVIRFGTSDMWVLKQVLLDGQYNCSLLIESKTIVDAGANIGLSSIFFANKYPDCTILALEPEESNFKVLESNAARYPQIKPLKMALWSEKKQLPLGNPSGEHWGFLISESQNAGQSCELVDGTDMDSLIDTMGVERIDVLKIDIEGAEKEVFEHSSNWIKKVWTVMAEVHDQLKPGCKKAFDDATTDFPVEFMLGETIVRSRGAATP
jgi:FkbM family methyltransferase